MWGSEHAIARSWQRATHRERMHSVSAAPAINLRPTASGVEVHVRYITRAPKNAIHTRQALSGDRGFAASEAIGTGDGE